MLSWAAIGKAKDDAILAMAHAYRAFAKERPGLSPATLRAPDPGDDERRASGEEILAMLSAVLQAYVWAPDEAAVHAGACEVCCMGSSRWICSAALAFRSTWTRASSVSCACISPDSPGSRRRDTRAPVFQLLTAPATAPAAPQPNWDLSAAVVRAARGRRDTA